jgi:hypothetical protein
MVANQQAEHPAISARLPAITVVPPRCQAPASCKLLEELAKPQFSEFVIHVPLVFLDVAVIVARFAYRQSFRSLRIDRIGLIGIDNRFDRLRHQLRVHRPKHEPIAQFDTA